jgi:hypothetical protein
MMSMVGMNGEVCHELHGGRSVCGLGSEKPIQFFQSKTLKSARQPTR